ncbi:hypothetical protein PTSG_04918 [Salpingoeca rosetta]|uniref:BZIP domain-containing protein n=1 Tax=Salpingoeca rosetta (strain ATCC 50818 / BSB-021) TaxID=946362 RepID=F2U901_SALR5|nr:uncharacterized protein PTSG_04918 [Salpingoeca rosetta]EGD73204.1 hypothetical protein PTSG_04918 [Salpingoeca rosetta]|eukprot:XP_004994235.1 hypothetical protein PTSG_04918 [Salpingoeca rosetta]
MSSSSYHVSHSSPMHNTDDWWCSSAQQRLERSARPCAAVKLEYQEVEEKGVDAPALSSPTPSSATTMMTAAYNNNNNNNNKQHKASAALAFDDYSNNDNDRAVSPDLALSSSGLSPSTFADDASPPHAPFGDNNNNAGDDRTMCMPLRQTAKQQQQPQPSPHHLLFPVSAANAHDDSGLACNDSLLMDDGARYTSSTSTSNSTAPLSGQVHSASRVPPPQAEMHKSTNNNNNNSRSSTRMTRSLMFAGHPDGARLVGLFDTREASQCFHGVPGHDLESDPASGSLLSLSPSPTASTADHMSGFFSFPASPYEGSNQPRVDGFLHDDNYEDNFDDGLNLFEDNDQEELPTKRAKTEPSMVTRSKVRRQQQHKQQTKKTRDAAAPGSPSSSSSSSRASPASTWTSSTTTTTQSQSTRSSVYDRQAVTGPSTPASGSGGSTNANANEDDNDEALDLSLMHADIRKMLEKSKAEGRELTASERKAVRNEKARIRSKRNRLKRKKEANNMRMRVSHLESENRQLHSKNCQLEGENHRLNALVAQLQEQLKQQQHQQR